MTDKQPWEWDEEDIKKFKGQHESKKLEFKSSAIQNNNYEKLKKMLTKAVSAFANTEGGTLIIGIKELKKDKHRMAGDIDDGFDPEKYSPETLQRMITHNMNELPQGLRFKAIYLSKVKENFAFIIHVPKGDSAYQASDYIYYERHEYESVPMSDRGVKLLFMQQKGPRANVFLIGEKYLSAKDIYWGKRHEYLKVSKTDLFSAKDGNSLKLLKPPEKENSGIFKFKLCVQNTGLRTIKDFNLYLSASPDLNMLKIGNGADIFENEYFRFPGMQVEIKSQTLSPKFPEIKLFPFEKIIFPEVKWEIKVIENDLELLKNNNLHWIIYLDDAPPFYGAINILDEWKKFINKDELSNRR
ncbi:MAG: hypothetical protein A2161_05030 [Candidatus Schekmanbacteria bacterium RBG_13_48_7]|uniref:Schlafen AlbA-2 domain-containing protein n=1 Tax=Candidatus Schekmanbacteria bacterium RBG_13_48_7 TaxID=1817878 RepID=A0A1F7RVD7_9BACT|nr:MAG: hypothetical protein A2161_05030 [Candidatus Schekmanbacteria bacterium RBG_13_48_7]